MAMTRSLPTADSAGLSIVDERLIQSGEIVSSTSGAARTGVLPTHAGDLVTALPSMAVSVRAFTGVFSRTGAGVEKAANNAATTVTLATAPNSNSRIDVIWARCQFTASTDANNLAVLGVTAGTAAQDPAKSAIPTGAIELATVLVPAGASNTQANGVIITPTYQFTAMEGGTVLLRNQAEQDAWTPHDGSPAFRLDTGAALVRTSEGWRPAIGQAPVLDVVSGAQLAVSPTGVNVNLWSVPGTGESIARPSGWFSFDAATGDVTCFVAGRYRILGRLSIQAQSTASVVEARIIRNGDPNNIITRDKGETHTTFASALKLDAGTVALEANTKIRFYIPTVTANVVVGGVGRVHGELMVEYLGPA